MSTVKITLYLGKEAKRLAELTGMSEEVAYAYVLAEDQYYDQIGLNVYDDEEHVEGCDCLLDIEEMWEFISSKTGIELEVCELLDAAEIQYYEEIGLIG